MRVSLVRIAGRIAFAIDPDPDPDPDFDFDSVDLVDLVDLVDPPHQTVSVWCGLVSLATYRPKEPVMPKMALPYLR
ncbi:MAG: hypothetical protein PHC78_11485 [Verrucomicrobiota bacterium]|nr:hypothetical protein [Verrucomicrobiota bacterium]